MYKKTFKLLPVVLFFLFLFNAVLIEAQYFRPFTSFRVIKTEYFDIIFPPESETSARLLASYADDVYREMVVLLGIHIPRRLPVTFTPHIERFNGFFSIVPNPSIVLFDTPMDIEWTVFADNLRGLFIHELAHAISYSTRTPLDLLLYRIFGSISTPALFTNLPFMSEGVTITFESLGGFGRANDPRNRQYLRQAIHEGRFFTPMQASGFYDSPLRESYYDYGGLFSFWLVETYGMENYAELWQAMGGRGGFSFWVYRSGFYRIFRNVYGMDFISAWDSFRDSLALTDLEENNDSILPVRYRYFTERNSFYNGLVSMGNNLYFNNISERMIYSYDIEQQNLRTVLNTGLVYDMDVMHNNAALLLSGYDSIGDRSFAIVREYDAETGRSTGRSFQSLYRARYFRDGIIALGSEQHNNNIVFIDQNGEREVLLQGQTGLMYSGPQVIDDEWIAFIAAVNGMRELQLYNYSSQRLYRAEISGDNAHNENYWRYMRGLSVSEGRLLFGYNSDDRMYKLAVIDLETMQAVFSERDFSGGVFNPVIMGEDIYYIGSFFGRDELLRFPETVSSLTGTRFNIHLSEIEIPGSDFAADSLYAGASQRYFGITYINPFQFWIPVPLLRLQGSFGLRGLGILSIASDPVFNNFFTLEAYGDWEYKMAVIEQFTWQNTAMGFPLELSFFDRVTETSFSVYRSTGGRVAGSLVRSAEQWNMGFALGGGYTRNAYQTTATVGRSAYEWDFNHDFYYGFFNLAASNRYFNLQLSGASFVHVFEPRFDLVFRSRADLRFPLSFTLYGAYDGRGMDLHGISNSYGNALVSQYGMFEYDSPAGLSLDWLLGAEARLNLFAFEIQGNISHLYFNRISGALMLRNQFYESQNHPQEEGINIDQYKLIQSLALRFGVTVSFFPYVKFPVSVEPYFFGAWRLTNSITDRGHPFFIGIGLDMSF